MKECFIRIRVNEVLLKKFKTICIKKGLSIPKQTSELLRHFVQIQEENDKMMKG